MIEKLNPFFRKSEAISTKYRQKGHNSDEQVYFTLDLSRVKPGDYTLTVKVEDKVSRAKQSSSIGIMVVE